MYKDDYISAFGKLAPSEEWMTDTLAKMRAAEAEQEAPGAAGRPALRVSGKKHPRLRRAALPVAAAVALLAVPAAWFWGVAMRPAGSAADALAPVEAGWEGPLADWLIGVRIHAADNMVEEEVFEFGDDFDDDDDDDARDPAEGHVRDNEDA